MFLVAPLIKKKRAGLELTQEELHFLIEGYVRGAIPDYQISALLMAIFFKGMSRQETLCLTKEMLHSGVVVDFSTVPEFKVDKHSTGGVGDKTSLILGPLVAAAGLAVPMISGRGLGHTGGTLDKLESIPGFNTQLDLAQFIERVRTNKICFIGQTKEICPADKKIYALRDVTGTVESLPLICASIMSKKLAEGIDGLVLDVKYGSGAFMKTLPSARELAQNLMAIAEGAGKKVVALITNMDQPLGAFSGNALEIFECVEILQGKRRLNQHGLDLYADTRELSLQLSGWMLYLGGIGTTPALSYALAKETLESGRAFLKFQELCRIHGGELAKLPSSQYKISITAKDSGTLCAIDTEKIGWLGVKMKAGRALTSDVIEPTAGFEFHFKLGEKISVGDPLATLYGADLSLLKELSEPLQTCFSISSSAVFSPPPLIQEVLTQSGL